VCVQRRFESTINSAPASHKKYMYCIVYTVHESKYTRNSLGLVCVYVCVYVYVWGGGGVKVACPSHSKSTEILCLKL